MVFAKVTPAKLLRKIGATKAGGNFCQLCKMHEEVRCIKSKISGKGWKEFRHWGYLGLHLSPASLLLSAQSNGEKQNVNTW